MRGTQQVYKVANKRVDKKVVELPRSDTGVYKFAGS